MGFGYGRRLLDVKWNDGGDGGHDGQGGAPRWLDRVEKGVDYRAIMVTKRSWVAALVAIVHGGVRSEVANTAKLHQAPSSGETRG